MEKNDTLLDLDFYEDEFQGLKFIYLTWSLNIHLFKTWYDTIYV